MRARRAQIHVACEEGDGVFIGVGPLQGAGSKIIGSYLFEPDEARIIAKLILGAADLAEHGKAQVDYRVAEAVLMPKGGADAYYAFLDIIRGRVDAYWEVMEGASESSTYAVNLPRDVMRRLLELACPECQGSLVVDGHGPTEDCKCGLVESPCPLCRPDKLCAVETDGKRCGMTNFGGHKNQTGHDFTPGRRGMFPVKHPGVTTP